MKFTVVAGSIAGEEEVATMTFASSGIEGWKQHWGQSMEKHPYPCRRDS